MKTTHFFLAVTLLIGKAESLLIQCDFCFDFEDGGPGCPAGYECVGMCPRSCVKIPSDSDTTTTPPSVLSRARSLRQLAGFCAEMCPAEGCPDGTVCRSNGCGHECLPTLVGKVSTRQLDGACVELCSTGSDLLSAIMACPTGYECRSNGCGHSCQKVNTAFHRCPVSSMLACGLYCPGPFAKDENGCTLCACQDVFQPIV